MEVDYAPALLAILLAAAVVIGFLGLAIGGRFAQPAVIVATVLAGVVLLVDVVSVHS